MNRRLLNRRIRRAKAIEKMTKKDLYTAIQMVPHHTKRLAKRYDELFFEMFHPALSLKQMLKHNNAGLKIIIESPHHQYLVLK